MTIFRKKIGLLVLLGMVSCQPNKDANPRAFQLLEGKWEQTGHQTTLNGKEVWVADSTNGRADLIFRASGMPLYGDGFGFCCPPQNLLINGRLFPIKPDTTVIPHPACQVIKCRPCDTVEIQVSSESMLWIGCGGYKTTYRKLP